MRRVLISSELFSMKFYRTSEGSFTSLVDYPFKPNFLLINGMRMHYVDEGDKGSKTLLLLHGNPSWSYLYRNIIPFFSDKGYRVIAPDLIGFGKSDKPSSKHFYNIDMMTGWIKSLVETLNLKDTILFGQDWGAIVGMKLAAENQDFFAGLILANGLIPDETLRKPALFRLWQLFCILSPVIPVDQIISLGCSRKLDRNEKKAYRMPFPSNRYKAAIRSLPSLVPFKSAGSTWDTLKKFNKPVLTIFSDKDRITKGLEKIIINNIPGAAGEDHRIIKGGHYLQEDSYDALNYHINKFLDKTYNLTTE